MKVCAIAGCVALAVDGGVHCPVHRSGIHDIRAFCAHCTGTGLRFYAGQHLTMACQRCGGTGLVDRRRYPARVPKKDREPIAARGLIRASEKKR